MKQDSRAKAPTLRLVSGGRAKSPTESDVELTVRMERVLRQDLKHIARVRGMTMRKLITGAVRRIVAEFKDARAREMAIERDD